MSRKEIKANCLLLFAASIWGFAFVAQRLGAEHIGPYYFNAIRFTLGCIAILPILLYSQSKDKSQNSSIQSPILGGMIIGCFLFLGATFQQIGLEETTAGKAAFITGLYIIFVPIFSIFLGKKANSQIWMGAMITILGLFYLSVSDGFIVSKGDLYELIGAFFWTFQILCIDYYSKKTDVLQLCFIQFLTCATLSFLVAFFVETISYEAVVNALFPLIFAGLFSVGIAFTLQTIGQRDAQVSHAAIIMSLEAVFAAVGGLLFLNEAMNIRGYIGCVLMLLGTLLSQIPFVNQKRNIESEFGKI